MQTNMQTCILQNGSLIHCCGHWDHIEIFYWLPALQKESYVFSQVLKVLLNYDTVNKRSSLAAAAWLFVEFQHQLEQLKSHTGINPQSQPCLDRETQASLNKRETEREEES